MSTALTTKECAAVRDKDLSVERNSVLRAALLAILIVLLYHKILIALVQQWLQDPNYSHGFFVPLFCGWILWKKRKNLEEVAVNENWAGFFVILGALAILILGVLGAENFLSRTSFLFLLAGLII